MKATVLDEPFLEGSPLPAPRGGRSDSAGFLGKPEGDEKLDLAFFLGLREEASVGLLERAARVRNGT